MRTLVSGKGAFPDLRLEPQRKNTERVKRMNAQKYIDGNPVIKTVSNKEETVWINP